MRVFNRIAVQPPGVLIGTIVACALMVVAFGLTFAGSRVLASHDDPAVVHICVNQFTGQPLFVAAGQEPHCNDTEVLVDLAGGAVVGELAALASRVDDLEAETDDQEQRIKDLESENTSQNEQIGDLETEVSGLESALSEQDGRIDELETTVTSLESDLTGQDERIDELEEALAGFDELPACLTTEGDDVVFDGCNVHIRNGEGGTETINEVGNLIIGYNENPDDRDRTGSHNLVVGANNGYTSHGGLVAGYGNRISGPYASVTGGAFSGASGEFSSVSGGRANHAGGEYSSVSGGESSTASGSASSVSGGAGNQAIGGDSSVSGGYQNTAIGSRASISGGRDRMAPDLDNWAAGSLLEDN